MLRCRMAGSLLCEMNGGSYYLAFGGEPGGAQQSVDFLRQYRETLVLCQSLSVAVVDLLNDDGDFETGKREIEDHVASVAVGGGRVALD